MKWKNTNERNPQESGSYLVSIQKMMEHGQLVFNYVAYYDLETNTWYKQDQFDTNSKYTEEITDRINAWAEDLGVFTS